MKTTTLNIIRTGRLVRCLPETGEFNEVVLLANGELFKWNGTEWVELTTPPQFLFFDDESHQVFHVSLCGCKCRISPVCLSGLVFDCENRKFFKIDGNCWHKVCELCETSTIVRCTSLTSDADLSAVTIPLLSPSINVLVPESQIPPNRVTVNAVVPPTATLNLTNIFTEGDCLVLVYEFVDPDNPDCLIRVNHIIKQVELPQDPAMAAEKQDVSGLDQDPIPGWMELKDTGTGPNGDFNPATGVYTVPEDNYYDIEVCMNYERADLTAEGGPLDINPVLTALATLIADLTVANVTAFITALITFIANVITFTTSPQADETPRLELLVNGVVRKTGVFTEVEADPLGLIRSLISLLAAVLTVLAPLLDPVLGPLGLSVAAIVDILNNIITALAGGRVIAIRGQVNLDTDLELDVGQQVTLRLEGVDQYTFVNPDTNIVWTIRGESLVPLTP